MQAAGFAGLALSPDIAPVAWAILLGAGLGGCFALSMIVAFLQDLTGGFLAGWVLHLACIAVVTVLYRHVDPRGYERALASSSACCRRAGTDMDYPASDQASRSGVPT